MIARLQQARARYLGINRRNHDYLFSWNPPEGFVVADDKAATKTLLESHGVPTPGLVARLDAVWEVGRLASELGGRWGFVLKPAHGSGGAGILVVAGRRGPLFVQSSGRSMTWAQVVAHAVDVLGGAFSGGGREDTLIVEELVTPDPELGAIAWRGVPDVRVLVFRGVPVLAMLRLPTRRSGGRANLHLGGVGVGIAVGNGRTTFAVRHGRPIGVHPDHGRSLHGIEMPAWTDILALAVRATDAAGLGFAGVDVVVDARRGPLVLELNARPGLAIQLANRRGLRPLLERLARLEIPRGVAARIALGGRVGGTA